jgi:hypothetical protein
MEKTNKNVEIINQVFDIICIIYDKDEFNFDKGPVLVQNLQKAFELVNSLNVKNISLEIWNATSKFKREDKIIDLMNYKFDRLVTWKPGKYEIDEMNQELTKDLILFFQKQTQINRKYLPGDKVQIERLYIAIGHRLLKANLDLDKVMRQLRMLIEDEASEGELESEEVSLIKFRNIKLHPDKIVEFGSVMAGMFDNNYFIPIDNTISFSKRDVFNAFGELLHSDFESLPISLSKHVTAETILSTTNGKEFADYLLHENRYELADAIRKEFSIEKGKAIRLLLYVLEKSNPPIITIVYGQNKMLHTAMTDFFGRNIGKYQSVFDYKVDEKLDKKDLESISTRLNHILSTRQEA